MPGGPAAVSSQTAPRGLRKGPAVRGRRARQGPPRAAGRVPRRVCGGCNWRPGWCSGSGVTGGQSGPKRVFGRFSGQTCADPNSAPVGSCGCLLLPLWVILNAAGAGQRWITVPRAEVARPAHTLATVGFAPAENSVSRWLQARFHVQTIPGGAGRTRIPGAGCCLASGRALRARPGGPPGRGLPAVIWLQAVWRCFLICLVLLVLSCNWLASLTAGGAPRCACGVRRT